MEIESLTKLWKKENGAGTGAGTDTLHTPQPSFLENWAPDLWSRLKQLQLLLSGRIARARISELDGEFKVEMEIPGVEPQAIEVTIDEKNVLRVRATRLEEFEQRAPGYRRVVRDERVIRRSVRLGSPVDGDSARLALQHGVLSIRVRRAEHPRALPTTVRLAA